MYPYILAFLLMALPLASDAGETVVAKVNGAAITSKELEEAVDALIPRATYHGTVSQEKRGEFYEQALRNLIEAELRYQDALAKGMKPDKDQVKEEMERVRSKFKTKKEFKSALERAGATENELRAKIEKSLLIQAITKATVDGPAKVNEDDLKKYYDANPDKFKQPESVRLRIISTKDEKKAKEILGKLKDGEDFGKVAGLMSEDNYRIMGGDIGYVHRGRVFPELERAAFQLNAGELSGLLKAEDRWFIIKVEDKKPAKQMTFEESKDRLKKDMEAKRTGELMEKWIADLRAKAKIEVLMKKE